MSRERAWMPLHVGDLAVDTMHLGATEFGIYMRLILHCWQHGTIPRDSRKLALIGHCDTRLFHQYEQTVLQFFDVVDASTMQHKRVSAERLRCAEISNKRRIAALQRRMQNPSKTSANDAHLRTRVRPIPHITTSSSFGTTSEQLQPSPELLKHERQTRPAPSPNGGDEPSKPVLDDQPQEPPNKKPAELSRAELDALLAARKLP